MRAVASQSRLALLFVADDGDGKNFSARCLLSQGRTVIPDHVRTRHCAVTSDHVVTPDHVGRAGRVQICWVQGYRKFGHSQRKRRTPARRPGAQGNLRCPAEDSRTSSKCSRHADRLCVMNCNPELKDEPNHENWWLASAPVARFAADNVPRPSPRDLIGRFPRTPWPALACVRPVGLL